MNGARVDIEYGAAEAITVDNGNVYVAGSGLTQLVGTEKHVTGSMELDMVLKAEDTPILK